MCVLGTGVYLPGAAISNRDWLARSPGLTTAEAIEDVTGILSRHAAGPEESVGSMAARPRGSPWPGRAWPPAPWPG
jgi:3-oxoacyl-[acyl-carrier-protein] synthase III